ITQDVSKLTPGRSTFDDAMRVAEKYRSRVSTEWTENPRGRFANSPRTNCNPQTCQINFRVSNSQLSRLGLTQQASFSATVVVKNGRVTFVEATLFGGTDGSTGAGVYYSDELPSSITGGHDYAVWSPRSNAVFTAVTGLASDNQRARAFAISMSCLTN